MRSQDKGNSRAAATQPNAITVEGAREHNLKDLSLSIPRDKLVVITGVSGSGKSSLAFDTIYAEGQRRYIESLSSYARQFLDQLDKPDVDDIDGLSPAIAIQQRGVGRNPRSTVGTITEIYDYLRVLFARVGQPHCWKCHQPVQTLSIQQMVDRIYTLPSEMTICLLAPVARDRKGAFKEDLKHLQAQGYTRVRIDGARYRLDEAIDLNKNQTHQIDVIVDRVRLEESASTRMADSVETCLRLSGGLLLAEAEDGTSLVLSEAFSCPECEISLSELEPRSFSFNSPHGACPQCQGLGQTFNISPDLIVPDKTLTLRQGALAPWANTSSEYLDQVLETVSAAMGFNQDTPWSQLGEEIQEVLLFGSGEREFEFDLRGRKGRGHRFVRPFEGLINQLERRYRETTSDWSRREIEQWMRKTRCSQCDGQRLNLQALHVLIGGKNIADVCALPVGEVYSALERLDSTTRQLEVGRRLLKEIAQRLTFLSNVGLEYLTLDRCTASLSGGEAQRVRLATQIGSALMGVLYVLDEPSIGLHPRDNRRLLETLKHLRDRGNTVLVVEHDEATIRDADHVVDLGPGAGTLGGTVVGEGTASDLEFCPTSLTGDYLAGRRRIEIPSQRRAEDKGCLHISGSQHNNLKNIDVSFPLGKMTVVTGVSGSGKSSLVLDTLYPALAQRLHRKQTDVGKHQSITGAELVDKVIHIDQSPIGRTPRSNPATYTGVFTPIRQLFAQLPEARMRGYKPGRFSFNVKGGRCETCRGDGTLRIEMHFLPDVFVRCDQCQGKRFNRETLDVRYKSSSIADVLQMTIRQASKFFDAVPAVKNKLTVLDEVGLGYLRLGQPATTLSGGEAQRIKISRELSKRGTSRTVYVLDEPTTGLHFADIEKLLNVLNRLVDAGNTVIVIEHNLEVIKCADWVIDLGPEGGDLGGRVVATGTPEEVAAIKDSHTGRYLSRVLA